MSSHYHACRKLFPDCPCVTCARDHYTSRVDDPYPCCCQKRHRRECGDTQPCKDYKKEKGRRQKPRQKQKQPMLIISD